MPKHTIDQLREFLSYDPHTGIFTWKITLSIRRRAGRIAGSKMKNGYIAIGAQGADYYAHRLAWAFVHGRWPLHQIDHINGIRDDNRITNIREASTGENAVNKLRLRSDNKSGVTGIHFDKSRKKWMVTVGDKSYGRFDTKEEAVKKRTDIAHYQYGEFFPKKDH